MIRRQRIIDKLKQYCPTHIAHDLHEMLWYLYVEEGLSINQITELLAGEASWSWTRHALQEAGIDLRSRGGPHFKHPIIPNLVEEAKTLTPKEIAYKHSVPAHIIYYRLRQLSLKPLDEGDDSVQE